MNKILLVFACVVLLNDAYSQFNTIRPKVSIEANTPEVLEHTTTNNPASEREVIKGLLSSDQRRTMNERRYLSLPIDSIRITSTYGKRKHPTTGKDSFHSGLDLGASNDYVYSIMPGTVVKAGKNKLLGNYLEVNHGDFSSIYGHLQNVLVGIKQSVEAGQPIAISGNSGRSTAEHLHFGLKHRGKSIDPQPLLNYIQGLLQTVHNEIIPQIEAEVRKMGVKK